MQIRCNFPDISFLSETQKNNFQFLSKRPLSKQHSPAQAALSRGACPAKRQTPMSIAT